MANRIMRTWAGAAGVLALWAGIAAAGEAPAITSADRCPANVNGLAGAVGTVVGCWCPAGGRAGAVWGSGPYTSDSDFCAAARHAGVVPPGGGAVWARITPGERSYAGSAANGVTTADYGPFGGSMVFAGSGPAAPDGMAQCPASMQGQTGLITCSCPASRTGAGAVWGTDIYTEDSAVCRAAVHAGAIGPEGGTVSVITVAGQPEYVGSTRNGVTTDGYGSWGASYMFAN